MQQGAKITKMLLALVLIYAICMLPQHAVYFWMEYGSLNQMGFKVLKCFSHGKLRVESDCIQNTKQGVWTGFQEPAERQMAL